MSFELEPAEGPEPELVKSAFKQALRLLARRDYSVRELRERLLRKGHQDDAADSAIEQLREKGFIDDARYAELLARRSAEQRLIGRFGALLYITQRGVSQHDAEEVLLDYEELPVAIRAARKKFRLLQNRPPKDTELKLQAHLSRRGFSYDTIKEAVWKVLKEEE